MRRSLIEPREQVATARWSRAIATGWPWKLPPERRSPDSEKTMGLSVEALISIVKTSRTKQKKEYRTQACPSCPLKSQCTKSPRRVIVRSFHEDDREAMHQRALADPSWMKLRREVAEHPFATIKWLMGIPRFLVRGLLRAKAELALSITAYNLKRLIAIKGTPALLKALKLCAA